MEKEDLIKEFEAIVLEITDNCLIKLEDIDANKTVEIFDEFQKSVADESPKIITKAIMNNVDDRITIIESIAEISIKYASILKSKVQ